MKTKIKTIGMSLALAAMLFSPLSANYSSLGDEILKDGANNGIINTVNPPLIYAPTSSRSSFSSPPTKVLKTKKIKPVKFYRPPEKKETIAPIKGVPKNNKKVIPVIAIDETRANENENKFLYVGFGVQNLTVEADNGFFGVNALDDNAMDIKVGYGQYFKINETNLFATGGFEYLALKQADMKAITASINTESKFNENLMGYIGFKTGLSYLVWDIQQDEAVESTTSTSPLIGIQVGIEYQFGGGVSLVLGGEYTKYFHETQIPQDILKTNAAYGFNISLKFYQ